MKKVLKYVKAVGWYQQSVVDMEKNLWKEYWMVKWWEWMVWKVASVTFDCSRV